LTVTHQEKLGGSAEEQWAAMHARMVPKIPHVYLFRLDAANADLGFGYVFLSYVPDGSPVRKRMLFASSREQCKKELGASYFVHDLSGSSADELSWAAFQTHVADGKKVHVDDLYSKSEKALIREAVQEVDMGSANAHAVRFPASDAARQALSSGDQLVVLSLDMGKETIELVSQAAKASPSDLPAHLEKEPRFVVFRWNHEHNGADTDSKIFVYYCPESAPVKSKMMVSRFFLYVLPFAVFDLSSLH
jgi:twinfilin-like protein